MTLKNKTYGKYGQEDCDSFAKNLLDGLNSDFTRVEYLVHKEPPARSFDTPEKAINHAEVQDKTCKDSITKDLFAIKLLHSWKCPKC